ncbi:MFS transporter [Streptomyces polygonati]|uniref:MFS transporter n=1 Tax=Streptomyces polygonati TaxID=1617087 RepID=A0ABV8HGD7_9ACTN
MVTDTSLQQSPVDTGLGVRGWLTLIVLCAAQFMVSLDFSVVTVALPEIGRDLNFRTTGDLQWVMTACVLPTAGLLLLFSRVADLVGRRRMFMTGVLFVTVFSLVAGLAVAPWMLVAARAGQGVAAAMIGPTALALLTTAFPEGPRRTRALGVSGAVLSLGFVVGTICGGVITSGLNWRWTMLIMVIIGGVVLVGASSLLPHNDVRVAARLDISGAVLATAGLLSLVYGVSTGADAGWTSASTLGSLIGAVVLIGALLVVENRQEAPLIPMRILNRRTVKWGGLTGFVTFGMCGGTTVLLSLYMQDVLGWSPLVTGLGFLSEGIAAMIAGSAASRLIQAMGGNERVLPVGLLVQAAGTGAMVLLPTHDSVALLLVTSGAMGLGHVLSVVSFIGIMASGLGDEEQGVVGGLAQTAQFLGSSVGVALLAAVVTARTDALRPGRRALDSTLGGLHAGMLVSALIIVAGFCVASLFLRRPAPGPSAAAGVGA